MGTVNGRASHAETTMSFAAAAPPATSPTADGTYKKIGFTAQSPRARPRLARDRMGTTTGVPRADGLATSVVSHLARSPQQRTRLAPVVLDVSCSAGVIDVDRR